MTRDEFDRLYREKHADYRGLTEDGRRSMLMYEPETGATVLVVEPENWPEFEPPGVPGAGATVTDREHGTERDSVGRSPISRPEPTGFDAEPRYPSHDTVTWSFRSPDLVCHLVRADCPVEGPHEMDECGAFQ